MKRKKHKTTAFEFGQLARFMQMERNPALDYAFCKNHLDGKSIEYQRKALLKWLAGYDFESKKHL